MRRVVLLGAGRGAAALGLLASLSLAGSAARAEEQPPEVRQALQLAAEFAAPSKALGFVYQGQGRREDGTEVELTLRVEPVEEGALKAWKVGEIWAAKGPKGAARRSLETLFAADLTPLRGSTAEDGTAAPARVEWLGGEKALAVQITAKDRRLLRTAWYAGQPLVEVGGLVLWARLLPRTAPPVKVDFCAPSWNRFTGEPQKFLGIVVVTGKGPDIEIRPDNAPEPTRLSTWAVAGSRDDKTPFFHVVLDPRTGLPILVTVNGTAYAGDSRPL
jgi:hypothetical protein